jgi:DNA mismatch endonuclease (patch repair protein)
MADVHSPEKRSYNMSCIHAKGTKPEETVRKYLFSKGFRYRKNDPRLPGKPDIVLPKYKTVIFVNGCFWHRHEGCKYFVWPKNNAEFWRKKIMSNAERDNRNYSELKEKGWSVVVIWECELKDRRSETLSSVVESLELLATEVEKN